MTTNTKPLVGISSCLLGEEVRYDGGHKRNTFITDELADHVKFITTCPEAAIGLGIPRPPIHLVGDADKPRVLRVSDHSVDVTQPLNNYSHIRAQELTTLSGYVFKKDSPSCGLRSVKLFRENGKQPVRKGQGVFAKAITTEYPQLPVEDEGRLNDAGLRENFVNRVFIYHQWQQLIASGLTAKKLIGFHSQQKYLLMAHSQAAYKRMGQLLSDLSGGKLAQVKDQYISELMHTLSRRVTHQRHVNVLQHIMGYLKKKIDAEDKQELTELIEKYRQQQVPLVVPVTMLRHYFRKHPDPYIEQQSYLNPAPEALKLRNHI